jgi:glyoxalase/bleomycin resistance protein/dioxygenase superfamily protein
MKVTSATPVLFVDRVEATRDFFLRAGFEVMFDVPDGDHLGFVGLHANGVQVMVETRGNTHESAMLQALTRESRRAAVFIEVDDLDAVIAALAGAKVVAERHTTFYKSDELSYEEPGGNIVTFAKIDR